MDTKRIRNKTVLSQFLELMTISQNDLSARNGKKGNDLKKAPFCLLYVAGLSVKDADIPM